MMDALWCLATAYLPIITTNLKRYYFEKEVLAAPSEKNMKTCNVEDSIQHEQLKIISRINDFILMLLPSCM